MGKVLYKSFKGTITARDFELQWQLAIDNNVISSDILGFIIDCRHAVFKIDAEETSIITKIFRDNPNVFRNKKLAYITRLPEQIILPILLQEHDYNYQTKPFSTKEAALNWIL